MSVARRLALIIVVLLTFVDGLLLTDALGSSSITKTNGVKQFHPGMIEMHERISKANISKKSGMRFRNYSNYFQGNCLSTCKNCGLINIGTKNFLIMKGDNVDPPYKYPFMVKLEFTSEEGSSFCGGSIINEYYILTAAHCIKKTGGDNSGNILLHPKQITVKFMTATYKTESGPEVEKVIPHPEYTPSKNDIALLKLKNKIICDKFKNPICLPPPDIRFDYGKIVKTAGWGEMEKGELIEGEIRNVEFAKCRQHCTFKETHYCFEGLRKHFPTPCSGDSGGPAFFEYEGKYYVIGIMSRTSCEDVILYTTVPKYTKWIKEVTESSS